MLLVSLKNHIQYKFLMRKSCRWCPFPAVADLDNFLSMNEEVNSGSTPTSSGERLFCWTTSREQRPIYHMTRITMNKGMGRIIQDTNSAWLCLHGSDARQLLGY